MNWKRLLVSLVTLKGFRDFIKATKSPKETQEKIWRDEIIPLIKKSSFWINRVDFKAIPKLNDFDITTYETYADALETSLNSPTQPLNGEKIIFWAATSGTTGTRKYFPMTASFQKQFQRTVAPFIHSLTNRFPKFLQHKILYIASTHPTEQAPSGIPMGLISNFNYQHLSPFFKKNYALPYEVFVNKATFKKWAPLYALATDLSAIMAVNPMSVEPLYKSCAEHFSEYLPYLLGEKTLPDNLPALSITKERATYLRNLTANKTLSFKTLWPGLQFICCFISGLCEFPAKQLATFFGGDIVLVDAMYAATEGWLNVPFEPNQLGGVLHPGAHIVEFIEEGSEVVKDNLIQAEQLEMNKRYEVFLTTAMGLVRYRLKDIVKCTGFYNHSPRIEFCYKSDSLLLDFCALSSAELQQMIDKVGFKMESHWYFARNVNADKLVLVMDNKIIHNGEIFYKMHEALMDISESYKKGVEIGEILPIGILYLPKEQLMENTHAQSKPKLISQNVVQEQ